MTLEVKSKGRAGECGRKEGMKEVGRGRKEEEEGRGKPAPRTTADINNAIVCGVVEVRHSLGGRWKEGGH